MAKYVTVDLLSLFKTKQDSANQNKFMQIADYVENGKIKAEFVSTQSNVVPIHVVTDNGTTKYYADNEGVKTSIEVTGEIGKLYIDVEGGSKCLYTFDNGFIPFASSIATEADIDALFD